jgi:hypothetical protein
MSSLTLQLLSFLQIRGAVSPFLTHQLLSLLLVPLHQIPIHLPVFPTRKSARVTDKAAPQFKQCRCSVPILHAATWTHGKMITKLQILFSGGKQVRWFAGGAAGNGVEDGGRG